MLKASALFIWEKAESKICWKLIPGNGKMQAMDSGDCPLLGSFSIEWPLGIPAAFCREMWPENVTMCQNAYDIGVLARKLKEIDRTRAYPADYRNRKEIIR